MGPLLAAVSLAGAVRAGWQRPSVELDLPPPVLVRLVSVASRFWVERKLLVESNLRRNAINIVCFLPQSCTAERLPRN